MKKLMILCIAGLTWASAECSAPMKKAYLLSKHCGKLAKLEKEDPNCTGFSYYKNACKGKFNKLRVDQCENPDCTVCEETLEKEAEERRKAHTSLYGDQQP
jgi:hypothetical protein